MSPATKDASRCVFHFKCLLTHFSQFLLQMEYTDQEKIVHEDDGEGGWVDTHPSADNLTDVSADMINEDQVSEQFI